MSNDSYSRPSGVLQNNFNTDNSLELASKERMLTLSRIAEIEKGVGPTGSFDKQHLQDLHKHIFQDTYPWAGHTRDESFSVDDHQYSTIEISKGGQQFLHSSRIDMGIETATKDIVDRDLLEAGSTKEFAERAGNTFGELNYVHPFREGNGRTQRAFITMLGQETGHEVDFTVITKARMTEASRSTNDNPSSRDLVEVMYDATNSSRQQALQAAFDDIRSEGHDPQDFVVRTAVEGETLEGEVLNGNDHIATIAAGSEIVVVDARDLPEDHTNAVTIEVKTDLSTSYSAERTLEIQMNETDQPAKVGPVQLETNQITRDDDPDFSL